MGLSDAQRTALAAQGLTIVDDFADFGKDELTEALKNMRTSIPGVPGTPAVLLHQRIQEMNNSNHVTNYFLSLLQPQSYRVTNLIKP